MARDTVAITAPKSGEFVGLPATQAITAANGLTVTPGDTSRLLFVISNTAAAAKKVTVKAGESPPALRKGLGDLVYEIAEKTTVIVVLESARFVNAKGEILIDTETGLTGTASVIKLPKLV